ncbi:MAG: adenylate/guanylate cyclase domain-containing protein [Leptospira sp.]|nr:adenylate/guanylate cyclase domain-containing protein [Leptospira sp.]
MIHFWNKIINIGVHAKLETLQIKTIRLTNGINLITILTGLNFYPIIILYLPQTFPLLVTLSLGLTLYFPLFYFNYKRSYLTAKMYGLLAAWFNISITSLILGTEQNFHLFLLAIIAVSYFYFDIHEKIYQYIIQILVSLTFIFFEFWFSVHPGFVKFPDEFNFLSRLNNNIGLMIFILGFFYYIASNYRKAELALEDEKKKLDDEKKKSENLLHNILPVPIADRLKLSRNAIADGFSEITILFADIVGFTPLSEKMNPVELVTFLNQIFSEFDLLIQKYELEKIKTIGDAYMIAGGLPIATKDHAIKIANFALEMIQTIHKFNENNIHKLDLRIGIHSGPAIAGVIGISKFSYDVWGNTVNIASRMESHSLPGKIQVSEITYNLLKGNYIFTERGRIEIKGKGPMMTYFLESKTSK